MAIIIKFLRQEFRLDNGKITGGPDARLLDSLRLYVGMVRLDGYQPDLDMAVAQAMVRDLGAEIIHADPPVWWSYPPDTVY